MHVIGNLATKGGVGKSTITVHLGAEACDLGKKVAAIDTNYPQGSLTHLVSEMDSVNIELLNPSVAQLPETLRQAAELGFDLVLIDGTPDKNHNLQSYAGYCDLILIPTETSFQDRIALSDAMEVIPLSIQDRAYVVLNKVRPRRKGVENSKTLALQEYIDDLGLQRCPITLARNVDLEDSFEVGLTVTKYKPKSSAAFEIQQLWHWIQEKIGYG